MKRGLVVLALALQAALLSPAPGSAEDAAISITLPAFITGPVDFEVRIADGNPAVCDMVYGTQTRDRAPWTFRYDPANRVSMIRINTCTSGGFNYYISPMPELAYFVSRGDEIREAGHKSKMFIVNNVELPGTVQVADSSGRVLVRRVIENQRSTALAVTLPRIASRLEYLHVTVTSDDGGYTVHEKIPVSRGWARISSTQPIAPCSTILWRYQGAGAPAGTSRAKVEADLRKALALISAASGLTFTMSADQTEFLSARHGITFAWRAMLGTADAEPQLNATKDPAGYRTRSQVWLNSLASGMSDRYAGSAAGKVGAIPGRVWPVAKALLRSLGLEVTNEKGNLMFSSSAGPAALGAGDRFALDYLYRSRCQP